MIFSLIIFLSFTTTGHSAIYQLKRSDPRAYGPGPEPPYAPDYSPECALIVTANKPKINGEPTVLSPGLQYISNYIPRYHINTESINF